MVLHSMSWMLSPRCRMRNSVFTSGNKPSPGLAVSTRSLSLSSSLLLCLCLSKHHVCQLATNLVRRHVTAGPKHRLQVCLVAGLGGRFHCDALLLSTTNLP